MADHLRERIKQAGHPAPRVEGLTQGDWVLVDAGDVIVHVFRPEARSFYALEKMWALEDEAAAQPAKKTAVRKTAVKKAAAKPAARRKRAS